MEKNLVGKYTYKGTEYEYNYKDKLSPTEISAIVECAADETCYKDGVFNYRPSLKNCFINQYLIARMTNLLDVVEFESDEDLKEFSEEYYNDIFYFYDSTIRICVDELIEHKKQEFYHRDQLSEAIGSLVGVITDKLSEITIDDIKKELIKTIAQVIHDTNEENKEKKRSTKKNGQKKVAENVVPINVLADK